MAYLVDILWYIFGRCIVANMQFHFDFIGFYPILIYFLIQEMVLWPVDILWYIFGIYYGK